MASFQWLASSFQFAALSCQLFVLHNRSKRLLSYLRNHPGDIAKSREQDARGMYELES
jgi:hypothetical protein